MTKAEARAFAVEWIDAWNRRDLEAVLAHYAPEIEFYSPRAVKITGAARVSGLDALRDYWTRALEGEPQLWFEFENVVLDNGSVTIRYRNHRGQTVDEAMDFGPDGQIVRGFVSYD